MAAKYQKLENIGKGAFGSAWLVLRRHTDRRYVLKEVPVRGMSTKAKKQALTEVKALSRCRHVNVIRYREAFVDSAALCIIMEYADGGMQLLYGVVYSLIVYVVLIPTQSADLFVRKLTLRETYLLDYCNSFLYNIASKDILKFQCVQNCLARVVTLSPRFTHSVPFLKSLRWLPVQTRTIFRPCTIPYRTISSAEPSYLFPMLSLAPKPKELRSSGFHLSVFRVKTHVFFSVAVPTLWNSLPGHFKSSNSIVSFRHHLKTHLLKLAYPSS